MGGVGGVRLWLGIFMLVKKSLDLLNLQSISINLFTCTCLLL